MIRAALKSIEGQRIVGPCRSDADGLGRREMPGRTFPLDPGSRVAKSLGLHAAPAGDTDIGSPAARCNELGGKASGGPDGNGIGGADMIAAAISAFKVFMARLPVRGKAHHGGRGDQMPSKTEGI